MSLGKMRHRIKIQSRDTTSDGAGGYSSSWDEFDEIWAYMKPASARENFKGMQIAEEKSYEFTIRYQSGISAGQRLKYGSRLFNIKSVLNRDERNRYLDILAEEGVAT
jgi:SPP1 family predicted phage head-tail adaptor